MNTAGKNRLFSRSFLLPTLALTGLMSAFPAYAQQTPISELSFADPNLQACVDNMVVLNYDYAEEVEIISCYWDYPVSDLSGIEQFTHLDTLFLYGDNETTLQSLEPLTAIAGFQQLELTDYLNDSSLFTSIPAENLSSLFAFALDGLSNVGNEIYDWLYQVEGLTHLTFKNMGISELPQPSQLPYLWTLHLAGNPNIDLNEVVGLWGQANLGGLELGGLGKDVTRLNTADWALSDIQFLRLKKAELDSLANLIDAIERGNLDLLSLDLEVKAHDWASFAALPTVTPNLRNLSVDNTRFDDYSLLEGFSKLQNVDLNGTRDNNAQALLNTMANNPDIRSLYIGHGSNFYCDDKALIAAEDTNGVIYFHDYGVACRTGEYSFKLQAPSDSATAVVQALDNSYPIEVGIETTAEPLEVQLTTTPNYDDNFVQRQISVEFNDGSYDSYYLRYEQPRTEPIKPADIEFGDEALARCVEDMRDYNNNIALNDGQPPEYAHEFSYMLCDAPEFAITDLSGLEHFTALRYLQMFGEGETINDVTPLLSLKKLLWLTLSNKNLDDETFNVMQDYRSIAEYWSNLSLSHNQLSDATIFDNWFLTDILPRTNLSGNNYQQIPDFVYNDTFYNALFISGNPLVNVDSQLRQLNESSALFQLIMDDIDLSAYSELTFPETAVSLSVANAGLTDLAQLNFPAALEDLTVNGNAISDLSPLLAYDELVSLAISSTGIESLDFISEFPNLETVWVAYSPLDSIASLASMSREKNLQLGLSGTHVQDYQPALDKPWLTLSSYNNAHVACSEFTAVEASSTTIYYNACLQEDGSIWYGSATEDIQLAEESQHLGRVERTDNGFNFIPKPGVEGWIDIYVWVTDAYGNTYQQRMRFYIEPGSNPALSNGIPIVILVSGGDDSEQ